MEMRMSQSQRVEQRQTQELRLSQSQRLKIDNAIFQERMALMDSVHGERFDPRAQCPKCMRRLEPAEILKGFNRDPHDFRTTCPARKCQHRFEAKLYRLDRYGSSELAFFCPSQTLDQLKVCDRLPINEFKKSYPAVYNSAKVHFGTLKEAFAQIGVNYRHDEKLDWKEKVIQYLGKMPDTVIAVCVNVKVAVIRALRSFHNIPRFARSDLA